AGSVHGAWELDQHAVSGGLNDTAAMFGDAGIDQRFPERLEQRQRAFLIAAHQTAISGDVRRQHSRQSPLYVLAAQDAPPGLGRLNVDIAQLWADVRLCPCPFWVLCHEA